MPDREKDVYRVDEVYGVTRDLPLNYVSRDNVDDEFIDSLATDKHIVLFGSSKQGKTSLRKENLLERLHRRDVQQPMDKPRPSPLCDLEGCWLHDRAEHHGRVVVGGSALSFSS